MHVVRDGRDASASRVSQTQRAHPPAQPQAGDRVVGAADDAGSPRARGRFRDGRFIEISIDELVAAKAARALLPLSNFAGVAPGYRVRRYYKSRMDVGAGQPGPLAPGPPVCDAREIERALRGRSRPPRGGRARRRCRCCGAWTARAAPAETGRAASAREAQERAASRLRRRHRPLRHPRHRPPSRPPPDARRRADRVAIPLPRPEGVPRPARRAGPASDFLWKLREFWWHRVRREDLEPRGLYNVMTRRRFDDAVGGFEGAYDADPRDACRRALPRPALPGRRRAGPPGPRRDELAQRPRGARARGALPARALHPRLSRRARRRPRRSRPRPGGPERIGGAIDWWADRMRAIDAGVRRPGGRRTRARRASTPCSSTTSSSATARRPTRACSASARSTTLPPMRAYFDDQMSPRAANLGRWRRGLGLGGRLAGRAPVPAHARRARPRGQPRRAGPARSRGPDESPRADPLLHLERHRARPPDPLDGDRPAARGRLEPLGLHALGGRAGGRASRASRSSTRPPTEPRAPGRSGAGRAACAAGLARAIAEADPAVVVFDGAHPYLGFLDALRAEREAALGLVPAGDVEAGREPGGAAASGGVRRRARAGRARGGRGPRSDGRAPRPRPPRRADRLPATAPSCSRAPRPSASWASSRAT